MSPYVVLMKPRVIWLLILASVAGYVYAAPSVEPWKLAALVVVGLLSTGGSAAFNHYWERDIDALMSRTAGRPLPTGAVAPGNALAFSLLLSAAGMALSALLGPLPAAFVAAGWIFYAIVYTVLLKRRTWLNVLAGGFAGNSALLAGYALGRGAVDLPAVMMSFAIYLWIPAHIWSLAYRYRDDYRRAGVPMFSTVVGEGVAVAAISAFNLASALYILALYLAYGRSPWGLALVLPAVAASAATSLAALVKRDDGSMWTMYKASSPVLALYLLALLLR